jgi:hypothetical protein
MLLRAHADRCLSNQPCPEGADPYQHGMEILSECVADVAAQLAQVIDDLGGFGPDPETEVEFDTRDWFWEALDDGLLPA